MTTETEAAHKHAFPCNPPGGTFLHPGPCECGKTNEQDEADRLLAMALEHLERAYGIPPRVSTHWAVAWGSENLNDGTGYVEPYDDEEESREQVPFYEGGSVVKRTVIALRWETVPAGEDGPVTAGDTPEARGEHGGHDVWGADFGQVGWHQPEAAPPVAAALDRTGTAPAVPAGASPEPVAAETPTAATEPAEGSEAAVARQLLAQATMTETATKPDAEAEPCQCHTSFAYISPMHPGHCCFQPATQTCHPVEVAAWEAEAPFRRGEKARPPR